jgi:hypothetical protein
VDVDGVAVRVQGHGRELSEADREALSALVAAVTSRMEAEPLEVQLARQQRQEEGRARVRRIREGLDQ